MSGVNKVILIGALGADPEVRTTPQGAMVANLRLAVSETWKDQQGQRQERTEWVNLVLWRQQAEIAQKYLRKGSKIYAEGKLQTRSWDDKQTGAKRYSTDVVVDTFTMLDGRPANADGMVGAPEPQAWGQRAQQRGGQRPQHDGGGRQQDQKTAPAAPDYTGVDDDLPFSSGDRP